MKNENSTKFIAINIIAAFLVIFLTYLSEPIEGIILIPILVLFLVLCFSIAYALSKITKNAPVEVKAVSAGIKQFIVYMWFAWVGWRSHELYLAIGNKWLSVKIIIIVSILACILTIAFSYNDNIRQLKIKNKP